MSQTQNSSSLWPLSFYEDYSIQNEYISKVNNIQEEYERKYKKYNCSKRLFKNNHKYVSQKEE